MACNKLLTTTKSYYCLDYNKVILMFGLYYVQCRKSKVHNIKINFGFLQSYSLMFTKERYHMIAQIFENKIPSFFKIFVVFQTPTVIILK